MIAQLLTPQVRLKYQARSMTNPWSLNHCTAGVPCCNSCRRIETQYQKASALNTERRGRTGRKPPLYICTDSVTGAITFGAKFSGKVVDDERSRSTYAKCKARFMATSRAFDDCNFPGQRWGNRGRSPQGGTAENPFARDLDRETCTSRWSTGLPSTHL